MTNPYPAVTLQQLLHHCSTKLKIDQNHPFYVERKGDSQRLAPVRKRMKTVLTGHAQDIPERQYSEEIRPRKLLFTGPHACGKSLELRILKEEIADMYEVVFIDTADAQKWFHSGKELLFFIAEKMLRLCGSRPYLEENMVKSVQKLYHYVHHAMALSEKESAEGKTGEGICTLTAALLSLLQRDIVMKNHIPACFDGFSDLVYGITAEMNRIMIQQGKLLLVMIDSDAVADCFLHQDIAAITRLPCSLILTCPLYMYSAGMLSWPDGEVFQLRRIKVHEKDQSPCMEGILMMEEIVRRRVDPDVLLENPEDLKTAILNSSGINDLFGYLVFAAINAEAWGLSKIRTVDLELAFEEKQGTFKRSLTKEYLPLLKEILEDRTKEKIIQEKSSRHLLMELMAKDMVAAYDVSGWYDLHPMLKEVMKRKSAGNSRTG